MITNQQIKALADIIIKEINPEKIYLFGSYAHNTADDESDVDLLIIVNETLTKERRRNKIAQLSIKTAVSDLLFPKDFKIYSSEEFEELKDKKHSFLHNILKQAKPLYAG